METPATVSAFSLSSKAYIREIQMKIKGVIYRDVEVEEFKEALGLIKRKLGLLPDFSKHVEELIEDGASEEEIRLRKRNLDYEFEIAVNMCHVLDYFITARQEKPYGRIFVDELDIKFFKKDKEEEMRWFKTQMDDFTERPSSFDIGEEFLNQYLHGEAITPSPSTNINYENKERLTVLIGLEVDVQLLSRLLVGEENKMIWIVGAKGIGKTTLAMKVCQNIIVTHHFQLHIWVTISQDFKSRDVLLNLMKKSPVQHLTRTIQYSTATTRELAEEILHVFSSVRCLVVLDGLRTLKAVKALNKMTFSSVCKSRIMITSRTGELADLVKLRNHINHVHEMRTLSDQEAWELFNVKVPVPKQLEELGLDLVRKCMASL